MDYFHLSEDKQDILNMSSLGLAYLGDAVYEVMVRSWLCLRGKLTPGAPAPVGPWTMWPPPARRLCWKSCCRFSARRRPRYSSGAATPILTPIPGVPPAGSIRLPQDWRPCLAGSISGERPGRLNELFEMNE